VSKYPLTHPFGEGRGRRGCSPFHASQRVGGSAHIPHERGGVHCWVAARGWEGVEGVEDGWWWWWKSEPISAVMRLMSV